MWQDLKKNEQTAKTSAWKEKNHWPCCTVLIRIDAILSKKSTIIFKICFREVTCPVWRPKLYLPTDTLWSLKTVWRVLGYTTDTTHKSALSREEEAEEFEKEHNSFLYIKKLSDCQHQCNNLQKKKKNVRLQCLNLVNQWIIRVHQKVCLLVMSWTTLPSLSSRD